jgi:hypothetical protein
MATNNIISLISSAVSFVGIHYWGGSKELSLVSSAVCWQRDKHASPHPGAIIHC